MNYHPDLIATGLKMFSVLVLLLGVLFVFFHYSKRLHHRDGGMARGKLIRILGSNYLGVKKSISVVEVPGAVLVLGITSDRISLLTKIDDEEVLSELKGLERGREAPSFSEQLQKLTGKFGFVKNGK